jgi:hypothetical protein
MMNTAVWWFAAPENYEQDHILPGCLVSGSEKCASGQESEAQILGTNQGADTHRRTTSRTVCRRP